MSTAGWLSDADIHVLQGERELKESHQEEECLLLLQKELLPVLLRLLQRIPLGLLPFLALRRALIQQIFALSAFLLGLQQELFLLHLQAPFLRLQEPALWAFRL